MPTTSNFGWTTPADTDLVKDGAAAIRTLGNGIDTSLVDLKGGTTGQVLSKASNTDLDFTWSAADPLSILDAKGDLISATAADTPARLAVGANDTVLTADSTTSTGLKWATPASGGETLISTTSLTGSTVTLTSIPGTYNDLKLIITQFTASVDATLQIRFNADSNANRHTGINIAGANLTGSFDGTDAQISAQTDSATTTSLIEITIPDYANATTQKFAYSFNLMSDGTTPANYRVSNRMALYNQTGAITSLLFLPNSGTFSTGTIKLYGVK